MRNKDRVFELVDGQSHVALEKLYTSEIVAHKKESAKTIPVSLWLEPGRCTRYRSS